MVRARTTGPCLARGACLLLALTGCDKLANLGNDNPGPRWTRPSADEETDASDAKTDVGEGHDATVVVPPKPLRAAERKLFFVAKGAANMGFNLEALSKLYALAGAVEVPAWSSTSDDDPRRARDDDLATAWTCEPTENTRCALGIHLPRPAQVKAVRLFGAAGGSSKKLAAEARIAEVRIHTEEGFVDAKLPDQPTQLYVVLGQTVRTLNLTVEVLATHGKADGPVHLAELEVYGESGEPREPWSIDPAQTFVRFDTQPWRKKPNGWHAGSAFVERVGADGSVHRVVDGTALLGRAGDRMLLLERFSDTRCDRHKGTYFLVDQTTRIIAPLGELGGVGADVHRLESGLGFAVGHSSPAQTTFFGAVFEDGEYRRKRTPVRPDRQAEDTFAKWGLDRQPLHRGGTTQKDLPQGCRLGSDDALAQLGAATGNTATDPKPAQWTICELTDGATAFMTDRGPCGTQWELHVIDADGKPVARKSGRGRGTHLRLTRIDDAAVLVEIGQAGDETQVHRLAPDGITSPGPGTALALRPPAACRDTCDETFVNPHARSR